jgi:acyl-CoA dehydrogenase
MSWDFQTEPEFEAKLAWMREFMRDEVWPLEVVVDEFEREPFTRLLVSLQAEVKRRGLWATHLPAELGGQGMGQVRLALMHEVEGSSMWGPIVFGNNAPDTGTRRCWHTSAPPRRRSAGFSRCWRGGSGRASR